MDDIYSDNSGDLQEESDPKQKMTDLLQVEKPKGSKKHSLNLVFNQPNPKHSKHPKHPKHPEVRKRVKTSEFQRVQPSPFARSSTMASSLKKDIKKKNKTTNHLMDFWKNKIDEELQQEEDSSPRSFQRQQSRFQRSHKKSVFETSINNEDSQKPDTKKDSSEPIFIDSYKCRFRSENVLNQMGREKSKHKLSTVKVSDFEVLRELGQGHFGKVLLVRRKATQDEFAVKLIPMRRSLDPKDQENLSSEARIFQMISNMFVVKAYYW